MSVDGYVPTFDIRRVPGPVRWHTRWSVVDPRGKVVTTVRTLEDARVFIIDRLDGEIGEVLR